MSGFLLKEKIKIDSQGIKQNLLNLVMYLSTRLNQTPRQIRTGFTDKEVSRAFKEIETKRINELIQQMNVYHDPEYFEKLEKEFIKINGKKEIPKTENKVISFMDILKFKNQNSIKEK